MAERKLSARDLMASGWEYKELSNQQNERSLAVEFMNKLKFDKQRKDAVWAAAKDAGRKCPEVDDLNLTFGRLPVYFASAERMNLRDKLTVAKLLSGKASVVEKLGILPLFKTYREDNLVDIGKSRPLIMLLNLPYSGVFALHDYPVTIDPDWEGVRLTWALNRKRYHLEPVEQLKQLLPFFANEGDG
jgi:hypothetical protein